MFEMPEDGTGSDLTANARLIAAAPELLAAAQMLIDWADGTIQGSVSAPVFAARQALCKATGAEVRAALGLGPK